MDEKIFQINWGTGGADIKISAFFIPAKAARLKKFCKLARRHSTETDRAGLLLLALKQEDLCRKNLLETLGDLAYKKSELANRFFNTAFVPEQGWAEKRLVKEREQLKKVIDLLEQERWGA